MSVVLCDIDFFKAYNDLHGHLAGDDCIRAVARQLAAVAERPTDLVARFGGEEFVLVMPHTTVSGAMEVVTKLRASLAKLAWSHGASDVSPHITLSFGVTELPLGQAASAEQLLKRADDLLYQAKREGRNRVVSDD